MYFLFDIEFSMQLKKIDLRKEMPPFILLKYSLQFTILTFVEMLNNLTNVFYI